MSTELENISIGSISLEERAEIEKGLTHEVQVSQIRYHWHSTWDYISFTLASVISMKAFFGFIKNKSESSDPNIIHYVVVATFLMFPLYYMQILIGQYTKLGTISFKLMGPIGHIVGITFIVNIFLDIVTNTHLFFQFIQYFLASLEKELPWLKCPPKNFEGCWSSASNCRKNCIKETIKLSAYVYYNDLVCFSPIRDSTKMKLNLPSFSLALIYVIVLIIMALFLVLAIINYRKTVKFFWTTYNILFIILFVGVVVTRTNKDGVTHFFTFEWSSFFNLEAWCLAIYRSIVVFGLGNPIYVLYGSYMSNKDNSRMNCSLSFILIFLGVCMCTLITETCLGILEKNTYVDLDHVKYMFPEIEEEVYFIIIPQGLGHFGVTHMWHILFFIMGLMITLTNQVIYISVTEANLRDTYPALSNYRKYVLVSILLLTYLFTITPLAKETYIAYVHMNFIISYEMKNLLATLMCCLVCLFYGVQQFCDDTHFLTEKQPTAYFKISWYCIPFVTLISTVYRYAKLFREHDRNMRIMYIIIYLVYIAPTIIVCSIEVFRFVKERNILGLFKQQERYGPEDPNERRLRLMFNPRKEIHSKRRNDQCQHRCLLGSKILNKITAEEIYFRQRLSSTILNEYIADMSEEHLY